MVEGIRPAEEGEFSHLYTDRFPDVDEALQEGMDLRVFRSGGGLRVARLEDEEDELRGYGEHFHVSPALNLAGNNYQGDQEITGNVLTGSQEAENTLDSFILGGGKIHAWLDGEGVNVEATDYDGETVYIRAVEDTFTDAYQSLNAVEVPYDTRELVREGKRVLDNAREQ
ncbi:MAG: hypothetical protein ABEJ56_04290 [Candidatus Nanohaloarchaea archaeon]